MANFTLVEATEFYNASKSAYLAALSNKSYSIKDRAAEQQKIENLSKEMKHWADLKSSLESPSSYTGVAHVSFA